MEDWVREGVADGFMMPPVLPEMLDVFIAEVIPLLQRRGLFRTAYQGETLRSHFGLPRPAVRASLDRQDIQEESTVIPQRRRFLRLSAAAAASRRYRAWPLRKAIPTVRCVVVPYAPGGPTDVIT